MALHEDAILGHLADNDERARAQRRERRQRHLGEASHRGIDPFGLDGEFSRGDQQLCFSQRRGFSRLVLNAAGIGHDAQKMQCQRQ